MTVLVIVAHPEAAKILQRAVGKLDFVGDSIAVSSDPTRDRNSLRLETELGVLDADLAPQLDRLLQLLRESPTK